MGHMTYFNTIVAASVIGVQMTFGGEEARAHDGDNLSFFNTHTEETVTIDPDTRAGRKRLRHILRDHRRNETRAVDPQLIRLLSDLKSNLQRMYPRKNIQFHVISGYRSQATNNALRADGGGQASTSRHTHGDAIDIRVPGVPRAVIRNLAWCLQRGGVGDYPSDDFVHIDTYEGRTKDRRFPGGSRFRAWGWSPSPTMCGGATS